MEEESFEDYEIAKFLNEESYFFTWTLTELDHVLDAETAYIAKTYYAQQVQETLKDTITLHTPENGEAVANNLNISTELLRTTINNAN